MQEWSAGWIVEGSRKGLQPFLLPFIVMAYSCPRCHSSIIRNDRSLGGRAICGTCGLPLQANNRYQRKSSKPIQGKSILAWLVPTSLLGSYLLMAANPDAIQTMLEPYGYSAQNSWRITTPADVELLIDKAESSAVQNGTPSRADLIRTITSDLISRKVRILISDHVKAGASGQWEPARHQLKIRPSAVSRGTGALAEVLAHETTHVAQSCKAGGFSYGSKPLGIKVGPAKAYNEQLDSSLYNGPTARKAVELEAYTVGTNPEWAPILLNHYC
jgi:hypothetical protein